MDSLGWDIHITNMSDVQPHEIESFVTSSADYSKMDLAEDLFGLSPMLRGFKTCNSTRSNLDKELASSLDNSINVSSNLDQLQRQEETQRFAADTVLAKSEALLATQLCSSSLISRPYIMNPFGDHLMAADYGSADGLQLSNGVKESTVGFSAESVDQSLECLLSSTTNSNTDALVEDDGISMIFSDCRNLLNYSSGGNAVSSGESENISPKEANNGEIVSQASLNPCVDTNNSRFLETRTNSSKRSKEQQEPKMSMNCHSFELLQSDSSTPEGGFRLIADNPSKSKKPRSEKHQMTSTINFQNPNSSSVSSFDEPDTEAIAYMKEMIYRAAAFRPVNLGLELVEKPKRKNVRISSDPQTVAARQRRERISDRIRVLQRLVPGGNKMDTASMLDEAANYLKFLRSQVKALETLGNNKFVNSVNCTSSTNNLIPLSPPPPQFNQNLPMQNFFPFPKP